MKKSEKKFAISIESSGMKKEIRKELDQDTASPPSSEFFIGVIEFLISLYQKNIICQYFKFNCFGIEKNKNALPIARKGGGKSKREGHVFFPVNARLPPLLPACGVLWPIRILSKNISFVNT